MKQIARYSIKFTTTLTWLSEFASMPQLLWSLSTSFQRIFCYFIFGLLCLYFADFDVTKFWWISYPPADPNSSDNWGVGLDDFAFIWTLSVIGPLACNLFHVFFLKVSKSSHLFNNSKFHQPIVIWYLGDEAGSIHVHLTSDHLYNIHSYQLREKFYSNLWILSALFAFNLLAMIEMESVSFR